MLESLKLSVHLCGRRAGDRVDTMVRKGHYLKRWPGTAAATFRLDSHATPMGVLIYSLPPREVFKRYSVTLAWELSRLWVDDAMPRNTETWFIAQTIQWIERNRSDVKLLISYADPSRGHAGTIYKAANWTPDGKTDEERLTPRFDYKVGDKLFGRAAHVPEGSTLERVPRVSKFRFIYRLRQRRPVGNLENTKGQLLLL